MRQSFGADHADRLHARLLHQALKPPQNEKRRPAQAANLGKQIDDTTEYRTSDAAAARAVAFARRRAGALDHTAATLAAIGQRTAALRVAQIAAGLAEVAR